MKELQLKYGCNPNQKPSRIFMTEGELPIEVINGRPGYINFLDAFNAWQLVRELKAATGLPAAASFKHVSPAGAAVGLPLSDTLKKIYFVDDIAGLDESPVACAYARARGADRMSSYGDFVALSDTCDAVTATLLKREVSDGVIAPDFTPEAIEILKAKRKGTYNVIKIDPSYVPEPIERKQVFGITFEQAGPDVIRITGSPEDLSEADMDRVMKDITRAFHEKDVPSPETMRHRMMAYAACRGAIKRGDPLNIRQMKELIVDLFHTSRPFVCPHGRPTIVKFTPEELGRLFKRP